MTWGIIIFLTGVSILLTRNLSIENPTKLQLALESFILWFYNFFEDILGKSGKKYIPYLIAVIIYLGVSNTLISILGFKPPTKDLNTTTALAIMSMILIEFSGINQNGIKHWAKQFTQPTPIITPMNILEVFIRPLSLCMRLFGNILGAFIIMELIKIFVPLIIPIPFSIYFDIFDGLLQAYIFVFLTAIFMSEKME